MNKDDCKTLIQLQNFLGHKPTEEELKAYKAFEKVVLKKGHVRLVDADALAANIAAARYEVDGKYEEGLYLAWSIINDEDATPTVIPENKEEK